MQSLTQIIIGAVIGFIIGIGAGYIVFGAGSASFRAEVNQEVGEAKQAGAELADDAAVVVKSQWQVPLGEQNDSGEVGVATLTDMGDGTVKVVILTASTAASPSARPAHVHMGACPAPGEIKYSLNDVVGGRSETTIQATGEDIRKSLPLAINLHQSATNLPRYVACGDIKD